MNSLIDTLRWDGVYVHVQLYATFARDSFESAFNPPACPGLLRDPVISWLEDDLSAIAGSLCVIDMTLDEAPEDISSCFQSLLDAASGSGAKHAWLQFDGGFEFG